MLDLIPGNSTHDASAALRLAAARRGPPAARYRAPGVPAMLALFVLAASLAPATQLAAAQPDASDGAALAVAPAEPPAAPARASDESAGSASVDAAAEEAGALRRGIRIFDHYLCFYFRCESLLCCGVGRM